MKLRVKVRGFELAARDLDRLQRRIHRLERRLVKFDPDLVALDVVLGKQARREEYIGQLRLTLMSPACRSTTRSRWT